MLSYVVESVQESFITFLLHDDDFSLSLFTNETRELGKKHELHPILKFKYLHGIVKTRMNTSRQKNRISINMHNGSACCRAPYALRNIFWRQQTTIITESREYLIIYNGEMKSMSSARIDCNNIRKRMRREICSGPHYYWIKLHEKFAVRSRFSREREKIFCWWMIFRLEMFWFHLL